MISVSTAIGVVTIPVNGTVEVSVAARSPSRLVLVPPDPAATPRADGGVPLDVLAPLLAVLAVLVCAGIIG